MRGTRWHLQDTGYQDGEPEMSSCTGAPQFLGNSQSGLARQTRPDQTKEDFNLVGLILELAFFLIPVVIFIVIIINLTIISSTYSTNYVIDENTFL